MALANYSDLKTAIETWTERSGDTTISSNAADCVALGEASLNRSIQRLSLETTLNATADSRSIDISSLSVKEPIALWQTDGSGDDEPIELTTLGKMVQTDLAGDPVSAAMKDGSLEFDRPLQAGQTFRFVYRGRFALSDANPTNDLLTNHPDVYLAASLFWGGMLAEDSDMAAAYKSLLDEFSRKTRTFFNQQRKSTMTPLSGLTMGYRNHRGSYQDA